LAVYYNSGGLSVIILIYVYLELSSLKSANYTNLFLDITELSSI